LGGNFDLKRKLLVGCQWLKRAADGLRNVLNGVIGEFEHELAGLDLRKIEAKFMLPWSFSEEAAAEKYMPQLQHNMWVVAARTAVLSVITGGGKWVEILAHADPLYQHLIVTAERKFWRCVESGEQPQLFGVEPPKPRLEAVRVVDMASSNAWAEFATIFTQTHQAHLQHEQAKAELKSLVPEDAKEAIGHRVRARRSKTGAISFDLMTPDPELSNAAV
jgi:predicted phage-related endonuclease